jgi:hypothetical protein
VEGFAGELVRRAFSTFSIEELPASIRLARTKPLQSGVKLSEPLQIAVRLTIQGVQ